MPPAPSFAAVVRHVRHFPLVACALLLMLAAGLVGEARAATLTATRVSSKSYDLAIDAAGNVYLPDNSNNRVRKVTPAGVISTFASTGNGPYGIAIDSAGNVYTTNDWSSTVTKITPDGTPSTFAATASTTD